MVTRDNSAGTGIRKKMQIKLVKTWNPLPRWYKWNIDASKIEARQSTTISIMCRDHSSKRITRKESKLLTL